MVVSDTGGSQQHRGEPLPKNKFVRHRSSSSCYSMRSYISNATGSSTRTHRRCTLEVSSVLFTQEYNSPGEYYSEYTATEPTKPSAMMKKNVRQVSEGDTTPTMQESGVHDTHPEEEMRSPTDHILSPSGSSNMRVAIDDTTLGGWLSTPFSKSSTQDNADDDTDITNLDTKQRAVEMIKELSFLSPGRSTTETKNISKSTVSSYIANHGSTLPVVSADSTSSPGKADDSNEPSDDEVPLLPPIAPTSPPLPPTIHRLGLERSASAGWVPPQVTHNRNRARSTSISEMSESLLNELNNAVIDEGSVTSLSIASDQEGNEVAKIEKRKPLITIENSIPFSPNLAPRPVSLWSRSRGLSSTSIISDKSSYISSSSSSGSDDDDNDDLSDLSNDDGNMMEDNDYDEDLLDDYFHQDSGNLSLQEGSCNTYDNTERNNRDVLRPSLNEETLREWNIICEEEYTSKGIVSKDQFIFRVMSCPYKIDTSTSPERATMGPSRSPDPPEEPHLMATGISPESVEEEEPYFQIAGVSRVESQMSLFSYTNSNHSTISRCRKERDEIVSELDMDFGFIFSYSNEKSSFSVSSPAKEDTVDRGMTTMSHRRSKSSGNRLRTPISCLPKEVLNLVGSATKPPPPPAAHKHRRFKSDGHIFCKKKQVALPQVNKLVEEETFPPKQNTPKSRHHRGQSLGSSITAESIYFDCVPSLRCILEEEASKDSNSTDDTQLSNRLDFICGLGFVMGLIIGLLIPYIINAVRVWY